MEREREWTHAKRFNVGMFLPSLKIFVPLLWETFWSSFLFLSFFNTFSFSAPSLYFGILKIFEETNKLQISLWMGWKWLHHEYESGGVADILTVDAYSGMHLCTLIFFWVRLANKISQRNKIDLKSFHNSKRTHPLIMLNTHKSCYVNNHLALVVM
jgi:hypothetical protein